MIGRNLFANKLMKLLLLLLLFILRPGIGDARVVDNAEYRVEGVSPGCSAHRAAGHPVGLQQTQAARNILRRETSSIKTTFKIVFVTFSKKLLNFT